MVDIKTQRQTDQALVRTTVRLPVDLHRAVKITAASEPGCTFQRILIDALKRFLRRKVAAR